MRETGGTITQEILALVSFMRSPRDENLPEASWGHLLGTLFHHILQKVKGYIVGFTWVWRETTIEKYPYANE
jgi:hypothetical protein